MFRLGLLIVLLIAWAKPACAFDAPESSQHLPDDNVTIRARDELTVWNYTLLVRLCSREVDSILGVRNPPQPRLELLVGIDDEPGRDIMAVAPQASSEEVTLELLRRLIVRRARMMASAKRRSADPATARVLAAALCNRIVYGGKGIRGIFVQDYRIPQRQFASGEFPRIDWLLTHEIPPASPMLFRLYAVHCDLFIQCLETATRDFPKLITASWKAEMNQDTPPGAALAAALGQAAFRTGENLQGWYERNALIQCRRGLRANAPEDIEEQLARLLVLPVLDADVSSGIREVHIEQVPKVLKDYRFDAGAIANLQNRLMQLKLSAPPLLHPAIDKYIIAVDAFRRQEYDSFRKSFAEAKTEFTRGRARHERVQQLLGDAGATGLPADQIRQGVWAEVLRHAEALREPIDREFP